MHIVFAVFNAAASGAVISVTRRHAEFLALKGFRVTVVTDRMPANAWCGVKFLETRSSQVSGIAKQIYNRVIAETSRLRFPGGWQALDLSQLELQLAAMQKIQKALFDLDSKEKIHLCICCQHAMSCFLAKLRGHRKVPFAVVSHGDVFSHPMSAFSLPLRAFYIWGAKYAYKNADRVYSVSRSLANIAERYGCAPTRSAYLPNGVDPEDIGWPPKAPGNKSLSFRLLMVGRLSPEKGHAFAIEALSLLLDLDVELTIVGDGKCAAQLAKTALKFGVANRVHFVGAIERSKLGEYYACADLLLQPSLTEAMPLTVIEAMLAGVPVVASNVGGIPDIISNGREGVLIEFVSVQALAETIRGLEQSPIRLKHMKLCATNRAKDYQWQPILTKWAIDLQSNFTSQNTVPECH